jgi:hypothetical protein
MRARIDTATMQHCFIGLMSAVGLRFTLDNIMSNGVKFAGVMACAVVEKVPAINGFEIYNL